MKKYIIIICVTFLIMSCNTDKETIVDTSDPYIWLEEVEGKKFGDFKKVLDSKEFPAIGALKKEVESLAEEFPTIGFDKAEGKYTK